jgi:pilus assembly protein CpaB
MMKLPSLRHLNKTWIVLAVALLIGTLAALAARSYLATQMQAIQNGKKQRTVNLIVAKANLNRGDKLSSENLALRPIPAEYAHSAAVTPDQFDRLDGQVLGYPVKDGEMILWGMMETKKAPTFSSRVEPGRRAITVQVDEINSISGMLEPGDVIDLILSLDRSGTKISLPLLQGVRVMATGQRSVDDPKGGEKYRYATVTLNTTPGEAQNLIAAREAGKLTALLRNPVDHALIGKQGSDLTSLLGDTRALAARAAHGARTIPVLYGGSGATFPSESLERRTARARGAVPGPGLAPISSAD